MVTAAENLVLGWGPAVAGLAVILGTGAWLLPRRCAGLPDPWPAALAGLLGWHAAVLLVLGLGTFGALSLAGLAVGFWLPLGAGAALGLAGGRLGAAFRFVTRLREAWRLPWPYRVLLLLGAA